MDVAQGNVTDMSGMVPMVQEQFEDNLQQLNITQQNALEAHNQSQTAQKVSTTFAFIVIFVIHGCNFKTATNL